MGVIQQGINQLLGTAAIAARLAPGYETRQEQKKWQKENTELKRAQEAYGTRVENPDAPTGTTLKFKGSGVQQWVESGLAEGYKQNLLEGSKLGTIDPTKARSSIAQVNAMQKQVKGMQRAQQKGLEQLQQREQLSNFRKQISSDVQDTINIMKGKDVPTQAELNLDKKISKLLPNFNEFGENAKQQIREQFKEGGKK